MSLRRSRRSSAPRTRARRPAALGRRSRGGVPTYTLASGHQEDRRSCPPAGSPRRLRQARAPIAAPLLSRPPHRHRPCSAGESGCVVRIRRGGSRSGRLRPGSRRVQPSFDPDGPASRSRIHRAPGDVGGGTSSARVWPGAGRAAACPPRRDVIAWTSPKRCCGTPTARSRPTRGALLRARRCTGPWDVCGRNFDGVVSHMALMDIPDLAPAVLRWRAPPGRRLVRVLDRPSVYGGHVANVTTTSRTSRYEEAACRYGTRSRRHAYHRPISAYVQHARERPGFSNGARWWKQHHETSPPPRATCLVSSTPGASASA